MWRILQQSAQEAMSRPCWTGLGSAYYLSSDCGLYVPALHAPFHSSPADLPQIYLVLLRQPTGRRGCPDLPHPRLALSLGNEALHVLAGDLTIHPAREYRRQVN
jgi:hypothetical protein